LNISPSATITFTNNSSLIINGTLNAVGTPSNKITFDRSGTTGTWGDIQFNSGSSGSIYYANISHATQAVKFNNLGLSYIEISHCTIEYNSSYGIYLYNSSPIISYNTVRNNGSYGIFCYNYSSPSIHNNTITGHSFSGVHLNYYSPAYLSYLTSGPGGNLITNNTRGVYSNYQCNAFIYWNSIYGNSSYEAEGYQPLTIDAEYNWWGSYPPNSSEIYTSQGAVIDYLPALSSNPLSLGKANSGNDIPLGTTADGTNSDFGKALLLQRAGKYEEAIVIYTSVLEKERDTNLGHNSLVRIGECFAFAERKGFLDFLNANIYSRYRLKNKLTGIALELENRIYLEKNDISAVINNYDTILNDYSEFKEMRKYALFNKGYVYLSFYNNREEAARLFDQLASEYPNDQLIYDSKLLLGETDIGNLKEVESNTITGTNPTEYKLFDNYPNPFNPSTVINYSVKDAGLVKVKIYDILGSEVAELINETKEAGYHSIEFNANNLPSGVYIYTLQVNGYSASRKMLLIK